MHIELSFSKLWVLGGLLLLAAPFLLFPTFSPIATSLALIVVLLIWLLLPPLKRTPFHVALVLLGFMIGISILITADPDLTLSKATGLILGLTSWYFLQAAVHTHRYFYYSLTLFVLVALGFTFMGSLSTNWVIKVPILDEMIRSLPAARLVLPESPETGVQANQLAGTILSYWPLLVVLAVPWRSSHSKLLLLVTFLITAMLVLTQSRSGWIGAFGALLFLLTWLGWLYLPKQRRWLIGLGWLGLLIVSIIGYLLIGPERIEQAWGGPSDRIVIGNLSSIGFRLEVWHWSVEGIKSFPFTGTGLGTFRRVVKRFFPIQVSPTFDISHAHNIFLQTALDIGLPGLIAYIALLLVAGQIGWQVARRDEKLRPFAIGLVSSLVALHIYGLTDALALGSKTGLLFWLNIGLLAAMKNVSEKHMTAPRC